MWFRCKAITPFNVYEPWRGHDRLECHGVEQRTSTDYIFVGVARVRGPVALRSELIINLSFDAATNHIFWVSREQINWRSTARLQGLWSRFHKLGVALSVVEVTLSDHASTHVRTDQERTRTQHNIYIIITCVEEMQSVVIRTA